MHKDNAAFPKALTIAGSDSGGGAGIQADLKTFTCLGVYGASVITALTAQNTVGVQDIHIPPSVFVARQLESVFTDIGFSVVKTGMLPTPQVIRVVADSIRRNNVAAIIVDPVLVATSGDALVSAEGTMTSLMEDLFPLATLITPNIAEASVMTGKEINTLSDMRQACVELLKTGCKSVLIKGGHLGSGNEENFADVIDSSVATDILYDGKTFQAFTKPRINTENTHGTGCTLASAIAAEVAKGEPLHEAVALAKNFVHQGIVHGISLGNGHGPLNHMHRFASITRGEDGLRSDCS